MKRLSGTLLLVVFSTPAFGQSQVGPQPTIQTFLKSADQNDFVSMQSVMDSNVAWNGAKISPATFVQRISSCYLRAVYAQNQTGETIAAWMCSEGPEKSRVVLGRIAQVNGRVSVSVVREDRNDRPAPPRTGSAFTDGAAGR